jgi:hypothetical protein
VQRLSPREAVVVTGEQADDAEPAPKPAAAAVLRSDKPVCVLVDDNVENDEQQKLKEVTFKAEKVGLALKAFRTVRMDSVQASADPLLAEQGKETPRLLLVNPTDGKVTVLEKGRLSASAVFNALESVSDKFYVQRLEKTVKAHLALLCDQDQLVNKEKQLTEAMGRADPKDAKENAERKSELEAVRKDLSGMAKKQVELWKLTPKAKADAS